MRPRYTARRFPENPLIHPGLDPEIGDNINGPSLIRVPDWVPHPLGKYYLYFAHHEGAFIRMAYADHLRGPWRVRKGGVLRLSETRCNAHVASPDVHVLEPERQIVMYFHGGAEGSQRTFRATSPDGVRFRAGSEILGPFYFRVFRYAGAWYAIAKRMDAPGGGILLRSADGVGKFEPGPYLLPNQRHVAVWKRDERLEVFFSRGGDCPERILVASLRLEGDWKSWQPSEPVEVLRPETEYEGGRLPLVPSCFGGVSGPVRQLRDPAIYEEDGRLFLLYSGAGESNLCAAELLPG
jgi:hypothetical protein